MSPPWLCVNTIAPELFTPTLTGLPMGNAALTDVKKSATVVPASVMSAVTFVRLPVTVYPKVKVLPETNGPGEVVLPVMMVGPVENLSRISNPAVFVNGAVCGVTCVVGSAKANVVPAGMFWPPPLGSRLTKADVSF